MKYKNFEEFLEKKFIDNYPFALDDELQEKFEAYLEICDREELMRYADEFIEEYKMHEEEKNRVKINLKYA